MHLCVRVVDVLTPVPSVDPHTPRHRSASAPSSSPPLNCSQVMEAHGLPPLAPNAPLQNLYALISAAAAGVPDAAAEAAWRRRGQQGPRQQ